MNDRKQTAKTIWHMIIGALLLVVCALIIWGIMNLDVLVKAMRYPEAVRQMNITVQVEQAAAKK